MDVHPIITIDLVLDRRNAKEALNGVLHAILFHRLFGPVKPQTFEVLDVTMPGVSDPGIEQLVNDKVAAFWKGAENGNSKSAQITVTFSEKRPRKTSWIPVYMGEEEVPWEQWVINAQLRQPITEADRQQANINLANMLTKSIQTMATYTSSERGRTVVPPITEANISPFPMKITVKVGGEEVEA